MSEKIKVAGRFRVNVSDGLYLPVVREIEEEVIEEAFKEEVEDQNGKKVTVKRPFFQVKKVKKDIINHELIKVHEEHSVADVTPEMEEWIEKGWLIEVKPLSPAKEKEERKAVPVEKVEDNK